MIRELTCYKCKCSKCNHLWTTKTNDLPKSCPKCHRITWNDDYDFRDATVITETVKVSEKLGDVGANPAMAKFLATMVDPEPVADEWRFTSDKPQHDEQTDWWFRTQYLVSNPKRKRTVKVDEDDFDNILRVM